MNNKYKKIYILTKDIEDKKLIDLKQFFIDHYKKETLLLSIDSEEIEYNEKSIYFLYLDDTSIKQFIKEHLELTIDLAILPNDKSTDSILRYGISKDIYEAIEDSFNDKLRVNDQILLCNGEVVFKKLSIGNVQNLQKNIFKTSFYENIKDFFINLKNLKYQSITVTTAKENTKQTVASGILVLEDYTIFNTLKTVGNSSFHDGRLNAFIIAPFSLVSYIYYLIVVFLYHKFSLGKLPKDIGFISTQKLKISSNQPFDFSIDDTLLSAEDISIEVFQSNLQISYGRKFQNAIDEKNEIEEKEQININHLPKGEINELLIKGKVPFFRKASDEDMKDALSSLRESSKVSSVFITLMILSTLLATVGIFQDSTPSVIGAMILAPLMTPIISLSMGAVRSDKNIIKNSTVSLLLGIISALFFSAILTLFLPLDIITTQMSSRINPNLLDLFVAIFSGIAGAYAMSKEEVAKSLAGVAIAVALVPPLAVTGIGIGWGNVDIIYGSFLLFLTNFIGMIIAASITFIILGFAPIHRARKSLVYSMIMLVIVSIPLIFSFYSLILQSNDYEKIKNLQKLTINNKNIEIKLHNINSTAKYVTIDLDIISTSHLSDFEYNMLKEQLEKKMKKNVILQITPKIVIK